MEIKTIREYLTGLQDWIVGRLEEMDGNAFRRDSWDRPDGGGGVSCLIEEGNVFERGGVNFSHVTGASLPPSATVARSDLAARSFQAMGVSLVLHPRNPYVPTVHMNVRFFMAEKDAADPVWWFGGGMDLTPYYGFEEDAVHFHQTCQTALDPFGVERGHRGLGLLRHGLFWGLLLGHATPSNRNCSGSRCARRCRKIDVFPSAIPMRMASRCSERSWASSRITPSHVHRAHPRAVQASGYMWSIRTRARTAAGVVHFDGRGCIAPRKRARSWAS